jgi:hypothetical protein
VDQMTDFHMIRYEFYATGSQANIVRLNSLYYGIATQRTHEPVTQAPSHYHTCPLAGNCHEISWQIQAYYSTKAAVCEDTIKWTHWDPE